MKALPPTYCCEKKGIIGDPLGYNYHSFCFVTFHGHTHTREDVLKDYKLHTNVIGTIFHKNIIDIKKKDDDYNGES